MKSFKDKITSLSKDIQSKVQSNPQVNSAASGAYGKGSSLLQGAFNYAKGVVPGGPLRATFANITSVPLPRTGHTIAVVKGRAYVFGGDQHNGALADNDMHVVILPSSGVLQADYTSFPARAKTSRGSAESDARSAVPAPRRGHTAAVVGDDIYVFGGEDEKSQAVDRDTPGRVWVYDTTVNAWSTLDPAIQTAATPSQRAFHGAAASEQPHPRTKALPHDPLPQQPRDPAKTVPDVPEKGSGGTQVVVGGRSTASSELLNDTWAFDIRTRTWSALPALPGPARTGAAAAIAGDTLFLFGGHDGTTHLGGGIDSLDLSGIWKHDPAVALHGAQNTGPGGPGASLLTGWAWVATPFHHGSGPRERSSAGLTEVTTGQGRHYLLLVGGETGSQGSRAFFDDVWTYQLPGDRRTAAGIKDAAKGQVDKARGQQGHESDWTEVRYQYINSEGDVKEHVVGQTDEKRGRGIGSRGGFAVTKGTEVDGASVVAWGGVSGDGRVLPDGWLITVER